MKFTIKMMEGRGREEEGEGRKEREKQRDRQRQLGVQRAGERKMFSSIPGL